MSIDYYLQSKKVYRNIRYHLKEIIDIYSEFIELTKAEENKYNYPNVEKLSSCSPNR